VWAGEPPKGSLENSQIPDVEGLAASEDSSAITAKKGKAMEHLSGVLDLGTHEGDGPETWETPDLPQKRVKEGRVRHGTAGAAGTPAEGGGASLWSEAKGVLVCPEMGTVGTEPLAAQRGSAVVRPNKGDPSEVRRSQGSRRAE